MIIIGNSNVNTFKQQGVVAAAQAEKVSVLWVGALTASDFRTDHPAAPWHVIAGDDKPTCRVAVVETVCAAVEQALSKGTEHVV